MDDKKPRIIFVKDDTSISTSIERSFRKHSKTWEILFVHSGETAIKIFKDQGADVAILDLSLPDMSGLELVKMLNKISPGTRCIILSGTADPKTLETIINEMQVFRFYTKPFKVDVIYQSICDAIETELADPEKMVLDRLPTGVLVLDLACKIKYTNQLAAEILSEKDGLITGHDKILRATTPLSSTNLLRAISRMNKVPNGGDIEALTIDRASSQEPYRLVIAPLDKISASGCRFIVFITHTSMKSLPSPEMIKHFFHLTPSESRLAWEMIQGKRTEEISEAMGITVSSTRTYLKRVMEKTDVNRQVDLVRLLLSTPQVLSHQKDET